MVLERGKVETVIDFIYLGSKITADGDCNHEIKRCLLLGGKAMYDKRRQLWQTSVLKNRHITLPTKVHIVSSVQFSRSVVSESLRPHWLQHARPSWPSPTPGVYSNSCPLSQWCHPTISSSVIPFCPPSFQASRSFPVSQFLASGGQSIWVSVSTSVHPSEYPGLISFRMDWLGLLAVQGTLKSLLQHHSLKASILGCSAFFMVQLSNLYMTTGKAIALTRWTSVGKVMSLLFNMLSRLVITFLPRSKLFPVLWLRSPSAVIFEPSKVNNIIMSK